MIRWVKWLSVMTAATAVTIAFVQWRAARNRFEDAPSRIEIGMSREATIETLAGWEYEGGITFDAPGRPFGDVETQLWSRAYAPFVSKDKYVYVAFDQRGRVVGVEYVIVCGGPGWMDDLIETRPAGFPLRWRR
jgi:hypothetical protein